ARIAWNGPCARITSPSAPCLITRMLRPLPATSALRQFQFDPPVAKIADFIIARVNRLEFAKAGCGQPVRRHALADQELCNRDGARGREFPVGGEAKRADRLLVGMAVNAEDPVDIAWNILRDLKQRRGEFRHIGAPIRPKLGAARIEQHLRSEEHTSELQSRENLVCRLLLEKKNKR